MRADNWHTLDTATVIQELSSSNKGLSLESARQRIKTEGMNRLPTKPPTPLWMQFLEQMKSPIVAILGVAALLKLSLGDIGHTLAIFAVIIFNSLLGLFQERKADRSLQALRDLTAPTAKVFRDGSLQEIKAEELVPGDCIFIESGMRIPADARLIESHSLDLDESMLTGESFVVRKTADSILPLETPLADQRNMLFSGTTVTKGRGRALIVSTGTRTQTGKIIQATEKAKPPPSPLQKRLNSFGWNISMIAMGLMALIVAIGITRGFSLTDLIMTCVSLTVSAVPEGLPVAVTVVLSQGLLTMARKKAVIRRLPTVETLGCTTIICTDKTGTLTENSMKVVELFASSSWAMRICSLCTEAKEEKGRYIGDPLDIALLKYAKKEKGWDVDLTLPYEPEKRMMAVTATCDSRAYTLVKGAPEQISAMCSQMVVDEKIVPIDTDFIESNLDRMTNDGLRTLALAYKEGATDNSDIEAEKSLIMVGLVGLIDPPRKEAIDAIQTASKAGIHTIMITGDLPGTACNIARKVGLHHPLLVCTGAQIDAMSDQELKNAVATTDIFARVTPIHKLRIIKQLQEIGEVVAMTGDGVNDAPPLQQADIGIGMGSGSDVAKEASDMVVLDDNLSSIVAAIRQGRVLFKSLQQMAAYLLTTCFGGVLTIAISVLMGLPLPLLPLQILWVNLVTDGTTTIPLAMEGEHGNLMQHSPRKKSAPFLSPQTSIRALIASIVMMAGTLGIYMCSLYVRYDDLVHSRTLAFATLSIFQMFNALNSRSLHRSLFFSHKNREKSLDRIPFLQNRWLLVILSLCLLLQVIAVEWSPLQMILETTSLMAGDWVVIFALCSTVIIFAEAHKAYLFFKS